MDLLLCLAGDARGCLLPRLLVSTCQGDGKATSPRKAATVAGSAVGQAGEQFGQGLELEQAVQTRGKAGGHVTLTNVLWALWCVLCGAQSPRRGGVVGDGGGGGERRDDYLEAATLAGGVHAYNGSTRRQRLGKNSASEEFGQRRGSRAGSCDVRTSVQRGSTLTLRRRVGR